MSLSLMRSIQYAYLFILWFPINLQIKVSVLQHDVLGPSLPGLAHVFSSIACLKFMLHNSNSGNADQVFCKQYAVLKLSVFCQLVFLWNTFLIFFTLSKSIHSLVLSSGVTSAGCSLTGPPTTHFLNWIKSFPVLS